MEKISVAQARQAESVGRQVRLQGWVRTRRDSKGGFSFLELNDGSCLGNVQIVADGELAQLRERNQAPARPAAASPSTARSRLRRPRGRRPRCRRQTIIVHGWADPDDLPAAKEGPLVRVPARAWPICGRAPTPSAPSPASAICVCTSIHDFFQEQGFLYVHPPIITASDCEGAGQMFRVTTLDLGKLPRNDKGEIDYTQGLLRQADVPDRQRPARSARSSPAPLGKVYTFGPTFRAENSNTSRHLAEFWMVEPEMAFFELTDNMDLAEAFLKRIFRDVLERCAEDMQFFDERIDKTAIRNARRHRQQPVRAAAVHRGRRHSAEVRPDVRVPGRVGQRPAGRARALSDRRSTSSGR